MESSRDSSSLLEEVSSLSYSAVFLYFFALFIEEGSPCYSLELCIQLSMNQLGFSRETEPRIQG